MMTIKEFTKNNLQENYEFFQEVDIYKKKTNNEERYQKAVYIYENFLRKEADKQINSEYEDVIIIEKKIFENSVLNQNLFESIENKLFNLTVKLYEIYKKSEKSEKKNENDENEFNFLQYFPKLNEKEYQKWLQPFKNFYYKKLDEFQFPKKKSKSNSF
jgi:hypothetical protein